MTNKMPTKKQSWERLFDEKFDRQPEGYIPWLLFIGEIKAFIRQVEKEAYAEGYEAGKANALSSSGVMELQKPII